ncbi:MAG: lysine--tRNA ligase [Wigglesworthia glossinidia]|nr:lysine--tRNA ligase [Wigglesworthia glossinidia]
MKKIKIEFPNNFKQNISIQDVNKRYLNFSKQELEKQNIIVNIAGRLIFKRIMGKASFLVIQNIYSKIQLYFAEKNILNNQYSEILKNLDYGDIIGTNGILFKTNTQELSIRCTAILLLTKAVKPLPSKFQGLSNQEICYRQRYLDLIMNNKSRKTFNLRSKIINFIRNYMINLNFIEVETPMMHEIPGGGLAKPFVTHHNALNMHLYLRIAPELYLKQLIIGGFEKIFEINRNFRNEGISTNHNPEFTMMEFYVAYFDYKDLMHMVEALLSTIVKKFFNKYTIKYKNFLLNFKPPFHKISMQNAICKYCSNISNTDLNDLKKIKNIAKNFNIDIKNSWGIGKLQEKIFSEIVQSYLIQPTFVVDYPKEVSPLAKSKENDPFLTERFELFISGNEICNGFSELNDPKEQKKRFLKQEKNKKLGETLFMQYDANYLLALDYGLPPTSGCGIGIDRLIMILTDSANIRDVIFFPTLRKSKKINI